MRRGGGGFNGKDPLIYLFIFKFAKGSTCSVLESKHHLFELQVHHRLELFPESMATIQEKYLEEKFAEMEEDLYNSRLLTKDLSFSSSEAQTVMFQADEKFLQMFKEIKERASQILKAVIIKTDAKSLHAKVN